MVVLRCTRKLLVRLKRTEVPADVPSTTRLGDWYGNILQIGRRQHLLLISERSRLPVVIPIREAKHLEAVFPDAVCNVLAAVGIGAEDIADERSRMSEISFGRTNNRSLLGTLNDFAFALLVGIASGAYSSIFVAAPLLDWIKEREPEWARRKHEDAGEIQSVGGTTLVETPTLQEEAAELLGPEPTPAPAAAPLPVSSAREKRRARRSTRPHGRAR